MNQTALQTQTETTDKLYAFDAETFEIQFNARPGSDQPQIVSHRLRRPTLDELIQRDQSSTFEMIEVSRREDQLITDEDAANARLWDKIAIAVKGYKGFSDWHELTETDKAQMRPGHKSTALRAMYAASCRLEAADEDVSLGGDLWTIKQLIGTNPDDPDYIVLHSLREPSEGEYRKFKRSASQTSQIRGARKAHLKVASNIKLYTELYDALVENIEGGAVSDQPFSQQIKARFLASIDPVWKRQVIQTLMSALEADLSD